MDYRLTLSLVGIDVFSAKHGEEMVIDDVAEFLEKKRWTIDWPSKRKKVDYRLTHQLFYVGDLETEKRKKRKWKRPKNPIKIGIFKVVMQKCEIKKMDF